MANEHEHEHESVVKHIEKRNDGDKVRVLRGIVDLDSDPLFVIVRRRDGTWRIARELVLEIRPAPRPDRRDFDY